MAYTPINFKNGQAGGTPLSADNLNHMEAGIVAAHEQSIPVAGVLHDTDLDTLEESGVYALVTQYTYTNSPVTNGKLTVARTSASAIFQNIDSRLDGSWMRAKMSSTGTWTAWGPVVATDTTLAVAGKAADAKKTGDEINDLKDAIRNSKVTLVFTGETYDLSTGGDGGDSSATIAAINAI